MLLSQDKIFLLLNEANNPPKEFAERNLSFGAPVDDDGEGYNTRLTVQGNPGKGYYNSVDIFYSRIDLDEELGDTTIVRSETPLTLEQFLLQLSNQFPIALTTDDLEPFTVPDLTQGQSVVIPVAAKADSYGWVGDANVTYEYGRPYLNVVISTKLMDVMRHPVKANGLQSADLLSWGKDFTSVRDALVVKNGLLTGWETVQQACRFMGIPEWVEGEVFDRATNQLPAANQSFDRVVFQPNVASGDMEGTIYLHYNLFDGA